MSSSDRSAKPPTAGTAPSAPRVKEHSEPPVPSTTQGRIRMAAVAMRLRDEQLRARVVYVDPSIETNAELDAITAQVVAELQQMQRAAQRESGGLDPQQVEIGLIKSLRELLEKMVSPRRERFLLHKVHNIQRRITHLFFNSEVYAHSADESGVRTAYAHADDALLYALRRHIPAIRDDLDELAYEDARVKADALERLKLFEKQLVNQVLTRSMPELERLLNVYRELLMKFLMEDFRSMLGQFAWEVIRESRVAHGDELDYKIRERHFTNFRQAFERRFLDHLLESVARPLSDALASGERGGFRPETIRFAGDPRIYAEICGVTANAVYDYLHGEGFLDLPVRWQEELAKSHT